MKYLLFIFLWFVAWDIKAQNVGSITVGGDFDKFYPTVWSDGGWNHDMVSELEIGRSSIHGDSDWRGSLMARFRYHTNNWGHGANFIDADITQSNNSYSDQNSIRSIDFIAAWQDATFRNNTCLIIIWLRGGGTTYYYKSIYPTTCTIFDGIANPLPFQEVNGAAHSYKTSTESYVNSNGLYKAGSAYYNGSSTNYFGGNIGIGVHDTNGYKLAVNGNIRAREIKVETANWPDFVFAKEYQLPTLQETEKHIKEKGHLPGIPSANEVKTNGIDLGEMNAKLLQKIEELMLYLIEMEKKNRTQQKVNNDRNKVLRAEINVLKSKLK